MPNITGKYMHYLAGLFDAEGYISLTPTGSFLIGMEICHEHIAILFKERFGGNIRTRKRESRKKAWIWTITHPDMISFFFKEVMHKCILKSPQMELMSDYLSFDKFYRNSYRKDYVHSIASLKKPIQVEKTYFFDKTSYPVTETFLQWMAGFMDGDGTMTVYEYKNKRGDKLYPTFDSFISVFNVHPDAPKYVYQHIPATITSFKTTSSTKNTMWKWVCRQKDTEFVCKSLMPYLSLKKLNAELILQFLEIKKRRKKGGKEPHTLEDQTLIRDLIKQIKHNNNFPLQSSLELP